MYLDMFKKYVD